MQKKSLVENKRLAGLRDWLIAEVQNKIDRVTLNGHPTKRLPNNVHFSIAGVEGEALLLSLDAKGIAVSTGSACSSHNLQPDHSLLALGLGPEAAHGSLRITLGSDTTEEKLIYFVQCLSECVANLRCLSPLH
jgi:cysteine desulfurase